MKVLLVGNQGFIGSHVTAAFLRSGHEVVGLTRRPQSQPLEGRYRHATGDRNDSPFLAALASQEKFDAIVDLVAYDAESLKASAPLAMGSPLYLFLGSGAVYAAGGPMAPFAEGDYDPDSTCDDPDVPPARKNYLEGKLRAEKAGRSLFGGRFTVVHPPIVLGPRDASQRTLHYVERLLDGGPILLANGGMAAATYVFVEDLAASCVRIAENSAAWGEVLNIAHPNVVSTKGMVRRMARCLGREPRLVGASERELKRHGLPADPYGMLEAYVLCVAKSQRLGVLVAGDFETRLRELTLWHAQNWGSEHTQGYGLRAQEMAFAEAAVSRPSGNGSSPVEGDPG